MPTLRFERRRAARIPRREALWLIGGGFAGVTLAGCGSNSSDDPTSAPTAPASPPSAAGSEPLDFADRFVDFEPADEPNGDLAKVVWPDFILNAGGDIKTLYEFQVTNGDLMRYMPCFCGCQMEDNHQNNRDCYVDNVFADGSVEFNSMAPT